MTNNTNDIFNSEFSRQYDDYNHRLNEIANNLHLLIAILLRDLRENARILCVGVGTGSEIIRLAQKHPGWHFTGVDPSPDMLAVCAGKLQLESLSNRCKLVEGYLGDVPASGDYDAVLCLLVTHFIQDDQRMGIYQQINAQLVAGGRMIVAEIAGDMAADGFDEKLAFWAAMHSVASNAERDPQEIKAQLNERLMLLAPEQTERLIAASGFSSPQRFFQSLLIHGWTAKKAKD
ncbi:methyltransferase [Erwinia typographi]|uniref:Methyltransferase n=1 Tax=Erwinia typographi TaxID=371042 RepID=A0A0A3YHA3_9GAMM|nr:class I SAM-dependent methyltransferase [Erwinia typographi]KGT85985.1 methyltransferase [Erwinia typographi]